MEKIIDAAIKRIYLKAESPHMTAVIKEVDLQCFKHNIKKRPHPNTVRGRIAMLSDRLKLEKRKGRKAAAEKYEPIKGHFPGADYPLAVAQIDHTPMDNRCSYRDHGWAKFDLRVQRWLDDHPDEEDFPLLFAFNMSSARMLSSSTVCVLKPLQLCRASRSFRRHRGARMI